MTTVRDSQGKMIDLAIISAGPYGLSIAAHLSAQGVAFRIFGSPMSTWLTQMPKGIAREEGILVPRTECIDTLDDRPLPWASTARK